MKKVYSYIESHRVWNKHNPHDKIEIKRGCGTGNNKYLIHHKDGNHENNDKENLEKITRKKHNKHHKKGNTYMKGKTGVYKHTEEHKRKLSKTMRGENNPFYGKKHSKETRKIISEKGKGHKRKVGLKLSKKTKEKISESLRLFYKRRAS